MGFYKSKFTGIEIDKRLEQGTYDDAINAGFKGTKEEFDLLLSQLKETTNKAADSLASSSDKLETINKDVVAAINEIHQDLSYKSNKNDVVDKEEFNKTVDTLNNNLVEEINVRKNADEQIIADVNKIIKPYTINLTSLLAAQDSESISTAIGGIDNLNGTVQKNQVIFGTLANGTVAVGIRVLGNQTTLTYFVDSLVGLTVNEIIITNTSGTLTKTANTHAVLTENMVVNSLESDETTLPLSAAQGKALNEKILNNGGAYIIDIWSLIDSPTSEQISEAIGGWDNLVQAIADNMLILALFPGGYYTGMMAASENKNKLHIVFYGEAQLDIVNTDGTLTVWINRYTPLYREDEYSELSTGDKTVIGAINELYSSIGDSGKVYYTNALLAIDFTSSNLTDDTINQYIGSWDGLVNAIQTSTPIYDKVALVGSSGSQYSLIPVVAGMSTDNAVDITMFVGLDESYRQIKIVKAADNNYTLISAKKVILDNDNNVDLLTDNKTITGAINENFNSIKTTNKSIGQPTIEEIDLTTPDETGYVWLTNHTKITSAGYNIKHFQLNKGDLLLVNVFGSTSVNIIQLTDNTYSKSANEDLYAGIDSLKTYSYLAIEDCFVAVSYAISAPGSYIHLVKSFQNTAIADAVGSTAALHKMYESYGAVYNKESGYWEYGDLKDMTEEECMLAVMYALDLVCIETDAVTLRGGVTIRRPMFTRTIFTKAKSTNSLYNSIYYSIDAIFAQSNFEYIAFSQSNTDELFVKRGINAFRSCKNLKTIDTVMRFTADAVVNNIFLDCLALANVKLKALKIDISLSDSPLISYESLNYLVTNAANTSAITVTVHPTTYSYLTGTAQPTAEVGGTTEEWQALVTTAQGKQISFAVPEETQSEVTE